MHGADARAPARAHNLTFDNRIHALDTDTTHYTFEVPGTGGDLQISARLIYRRAFRFLTVAKNWTEDGHGNPLADVQAPHFGHLMESAELVVTACPPGADLDGSGDVGFDDVITILSTSGPCLGCPQDLHGDGVIGFPDLIIVLGHWGPCV